MPSYKLLPTEEERFARSLILEGLEDEAGNKSSLSPRRGIISGSFGEEPNDDLFWANYGWERTGTRLTWEGEADYSYVESYPIIFLQNGYIGHLRGPKDVTSEIRSTIQRIIHSGIALNQIEFEPDDLVVVLEEADSVQRLDVAPTGQSDPDHLSASDRNDLRETDFVKDYEGEPFEKVKISPPGEDIDVNIGFDQNGTVILYGRNMELSNQATALRFLCETVIDEYVANNFHQGNLSRF